MSAVPRLRHRDGRPGSTGQRSTGQRATGLDVYSPGRATATRERHLTTNAALLFGAAGNRPPPSPSSATRDPFGTPAPEPAPNPPCPTAPPTSRPPATPHPVRLTPRPAGRHAAGVRPVSSPWPAEGRATGGQ
ncbi:hypothetical protein ATKI12_9087 [Kitasatospora sp. Ki12]